MSGFDPGEGRRWIVAAAMEAALGDGPVENVSFGPTLVYRSSLQLQTGAPAVSSDPQRSTATSPHDLGLN